MNRGSRPSRQKKTETQKKPGSAGHRGGRGGRPSRSSRDRILLVALLALIAVLLGVVVALLPNTAPGDQVRSIAEGGGVSGPAADAGVQDKGEDQGAVGTPGTNEMGEEGSDEDTDDDNRSLEPDTGEGTVTEDYPVGERPEAQPVDREAENWWLPPDDVAPEARGPLVLVIDDAGNTLEAFDRFLAFPAPFAVAVLPQLDYSVQTAALTAGAGKEILLHQPMEAEGDTNPGPGVIGPTMEPARIARLLSENLASVPGAIGVNNHMGSLATTRPEVMRPLLVTLHARGLFFLDSRTSAATVGRAIAAEVGLPFAERRVFLDNERTADGILLSLRHALELSQRGKPVVMIGHATVPLLADVLNDVYPVILEHGYSFAPLSELVSPVRVAAERDL